MDDNKKKFYLLRGLPGSGKTTRANEIYRNSLDDLHFAHMYEADHYFVRPDGLYDFNPRLLPQAHAWCKLCCFESMASGVDTIIQSNTNIKKMHMDAYIKTAEEFGYEVIIEVIGGFSEENIQEYFKRQKHGVPLDTMRRMAADFEK